MALNTFQGTPNMFEPLRDAISSDDCKIIACTINILIKNFAEIYNLRQEGDKLSGGMLAGRLANANFR